MSLNNEPSQLDEDEDRDVDAIDSARIPGCPPETLHPQFDGQPLMVNHQPETIDHTPYTIHPTPSTPKPKPYTLNLKP